MKSVQMFALIVGYCLFAAIMGWTVFGNIYSTVGKAHGLYSLCKVTFAVGLLISLIFLYLTKKPNKFVLYALIPYLAIQIIYPVMLVTDGYSLSGYFKNAVFLTHPYLMSFAWVLTLVMFAIDYALTRKLMKKPV